MICHDLPIKNGDFPYVKLADGQFWKRFPPLKIWQVLLDPRASSFAAALDLHGGTTWVSRNWWMEEFQAICFFFFFFLSDHLFQTMCICLEVPIFFQQQVDFFLSAHFFPAARKIKAWFRSCFVFHGSRARVQHDLTIFTIFGYTLW